MQGQIFGDKPVFFFFFFFSFQFRELFSFVALPARILLLPLL